MSLITPSAEHSKHHLGWQWNDIKFEIKARVHLRLAHDSDELDLVVGSHSDRTENVVGKPGVRKLQLGYLEQGDRIRMILHHPEIADTMSLLLTIDHQCNKELQLVAWRYPEFERKFLLRGESMLYLMRSSKPMDPVKQLAVQPERERSAQEAEDRRKENDMFYIEKMKEQDRKRSATEVHRP